jgi:hypothetical protein
MISQIVRRVGSIWRLAGCSNEHDEDAVIGWSRGRGQAVTANTALPIVMAKRQNPVDCVDNTLH